MMVGSVCGEEEIDGLTMIAFTYLLCKIGAAVTAPGFGGRDEGRLVGTLRTPPSAPVYYAPHTFSTGPWQRESDAGLPLCTVCVMVHSSELSVTVASPWLWLITSSCV